MSSPETIPRQSPTGCRVAILGAGRMAREHARAFQSIPGIRVAGIYSRTRTRAEALAQELGIDAVYDSVDDLYRGTQADLAVVAVSELAMKETGIRCLQYPWFILLEKPAG